jgi:hypothetical protein
MRVTVKRNLIIFHKVHEWEDFSHQLVKEYGASILISWKMKRELGFTVRHHRGLVPNQADEEGWLEEEFRHKYHYEDQVHLDFFNDSSQSWFQLKYLK